MMLCRQLVEAVKKLKVGGVTAQWQQVHYRPLDQCCGGDPRYNSTKGCHRQVRRS